MKTPEKSLIMKIENEYIYAKYTKSDLEQLIRYGNPTAADITNYIISHKLTIVEKNTLLLYIYLKGYDNLAKYLDISVGCAHSYVKKIKIKIQQELRQWYV